MEYEKFLSGYCRVMDCSRTVTAELTDNQLTYADCCYGNCIYQASCPIAVELDKLK